MGYWDQIGVDNMRAAARPPSLWRKIMWGAVIVLGTAFLIAVQVMPGLVR